MFCYACCMPPFYYSLELHAQCDLYAYPWEATLVAGTSAGNTGLKIFDRDGVLIESFADYQNWGFEALQSGSVRWLRLHDLEENFTYGNTPLQFVISEILWRASDWTPVTDNGVKYRYDRITNARAEVHIRN